MEAIYLNIILILFTAVLLFLLIKSKFSPEIKYLISLFICLEGLSSLLLASKVSLWVGFLTFILGIISLIYIKKNNDVGLVATDLQEDSIIKSLTFGGKYLKLITIIGFLILLIEVILFTNFSNIGISDNNYIGQLDMLVIICGLNWIFFNYIPERYGRERDFIFLFSNCLVLFIVVPTVTYSYFYGERSLYSENSGFVELLLTKPLSLILNLLGIDAYAFGSYLSYYNSDDDLQRVWIATQCSGIFSVQIFISAFLSFFLVERNSFPLPFYILAFLGILTAYIANLFRMAIIVLVGYHYGNEAMYWAHENLGWIIFLLWIALFWSFLVNYVLLPQPNKIGN